ncbi:MAG: hypothetical protein KDD37_08135 [Bdellovibrionales bacterium]|nr:hypothetical protein [Bdellovibrionales bacterium]
MNEPYSVLTNKELYPESKKPHDHPDFFSNCGDYHSLEEAELRAKLLRRKYPKIRIAILDHRLDQIIEIREDVID